jgi:hypothetical protein
MAKESELAKRLKQFITDADKIVDSGKKLLEELKPQTPPDDQKESKDNER